MIQSTKNYERFKKLSCNRETMSEKHLDRLQKSIQTNNLLQYRPILINKNFEVIDGQHRLEIAKRMGIEIFYQIEDDLTVNDIILVNNQKPWGNGDYLNFYVKNHYPEYMKLDKFLKDNDLSLKIALLIFIGSGHNGLNDFREGKFKFKEEYKDTKVEQCWETVYYIKKMNGGSTYTMSAKFWKSLNKLMNCEGFDQSIWMKNLERHIHKMHIHNSAEDYFKTMLSIYNWKNNRKLSEEVEE